MEFTPSPSSIFQNKKIKYNNKKPIKNGTNMDKFFKNTQGSLHFRSPIFCSVSLRKTSYIPNVIEKRICRQARRSRAKPAKLARKT